MSCDNLPEGDVVFLLDDNQFPVACNKNNDKFICTNVVDGKTPVLFTKGIGDQGCGWYFCDVDTRTGEIDYDNCRESPYRFYTEKIKNADGLFCALRSLNKPQVLASMKISGDGSGDCCCNPSSRCDFDNCCPNESLTCMSGSGCDWCDINSNNPYLGYKDVLKRKMYACMNPSGNMVCTQIPDDYEQHKNYYPEVEKAENRGGATGGIFYSQFCNCDKSQGCKDDPNNCSPLGGCTPCNPLTEPGDYTCADHQCIEKKGQGNYASLSECEQNCGTNDKYTCLETGCVKDPAGNYLSQGACETACSSLLSGPITYDEKKILTAWFIYTALAFLIIILILVLLWVFNFVRRKRR